MRLLNTHNLNLEEFFPQDVPRYAILSHTWGSEEITFSELKRSNRKAGYKKIRGFCDRAVEAGLDYAWVDTCCINKDSSAELSESLNSMFRWYANATICYAYLDDVQGNLSEKETEEAFERSRWLTRGWTLQELIAPKSVVFYGANWAKLGTRDSLKSTIEKVTGIHSLALDGNFEKVRKEFSIAQRMSWAADRKTTRVEDEAYCLLGIFNVNMPLLYGEREKAFIRLQEHIINESNDQSIFCWSDVTITLGSAKTNHSGYFFNTATGLLAPSPLPFRGCGRIAKIPSLKISDEFKMTKLGLSITGPVISLRERDYWAGLGDHLMYLRCYDQDAPNHHLAIMLRQLGEDNFSRKNRTLCRLPGPLWKGTQNKRIYIRKEAAIPSYVEILQIGKSLAFRIDTGSSGENFQVTGCWPKDQWLSDRNEVHSPPWHVEDVSINNWSWHAALSLRILTPAHSRLRKKHDYSVGCTLILGYDGINDRCWTRLTAGTRNLRDTWEKSVNTTVKGATYTLSAPNFVWTIKTEVSDLREEVVVSQGDGSQEDQRSHRSYAVPVKVEISKVRSGPHKRKAGNAFSVSDIQLVSRKVVPKQSFASLVTQAA